MQPEFVLTALIVCIAPGIGVIYTLSAALSQGARAGVLAALGCAISTAVHLAAALAGLAAILHASSVLFQGVKIAGAALLMWMAWSTLRQTGALQVRPQAPRSPARLIGHGIALNLMNPKLPLFFLAFLPQFIPADDPAPGATMTELGLVFVGLTFAVFTVYALLAGGLRAHVVENKRAMTWIRRVFAASFAGLGLRLALETR